MFVVHLEFAIARSAELKQQDRLLELLAGWDSSLVLSAGEENQDRCVALAISTLAVRLGFVPVSQAGAPVHLLTVELLRLVAAGMSLPRSNLAYVSEETWRRLGTLPPNWRAAIRSALQSPDEWDCDRIATECCTTLRTLQRTLLRAGLPSPARMLRAARERCRKTVANRAGTPPAVRIF